MMHVCRTADGSYIDARVCMTHDGSEISFRAIIQL